MTGCTKCPDNSGTQGKTGRLQIADCHCNLGYEWDPNAIRTCRSTLVYHRSARANFVNKRIRSLKGERNLPFGQEVSHLKASLIK